MNTDGRFGKVVVLAVEGQRVTVRCDCGVEYTIDKFYLKRRQHTQCRSCGWAKRRTVQIGNRYDHLVVANLKSENGRLWAVCKCDCGNTITTRSEVLLGNKTNSCGCMPGAHWKGFGGLSLSYYHRLKAGAVNRGVPFDVSIQYLWGLLEKQEHKCALSGLPICLNLQVAGKSTASVDRIDNSLGYQIGNVQWLHREVNRMKLHYPQDYFLNLCGCITDHQKGVEVTVPDSIFQENKGIRNKM